jgi:hypothetical protein
VAVLPIALASMAAVTLHIANDHDARKRRSFRRVLDLTQTVRRQ